MAGLAERGVDQRVGHPERDALDFAVGQAPDVFQDDVGLDAVDDQERPVKAVACGYGHQRRKGLDRVLQDAHPVTAPVRFFLQQPGALERPLLERELRRGAQLRLELLEARKGLHEQLLHAFATARVVGSEGAQRPERAVDHRGDERAAAREVPVGGRTRKVQAHRGLGDRRDVSALPNDVHRRVEQEPERSGLDTALGGQRRLAGLVLQARHGVCPEAEWGRLRLWRSKLGSYGARIPI